MNNVIIFSIVAGTIIVALATYAIFLKRMLVRVAKDYLQASFDLEITLSAMNDLVSKKEDVAIEKTEGFLRFVSDSRDWAFQYIEETQSVITEFVNVVGPAMEYYDKYGRISESETMNKIFDAYQKLITVLPENENKQQGENNE